MQQIVDLHNDPDFQSLDVALVSIALDSTAELEGGVQAFGISGVPLLTDAEAQVSAAYDVLKWAVPSGEPGHTFILVDGSGEVRWIKDYGAPDNPNRTMYVPVEELTAAVRDNLR
jgi:peroxiredoxin